MEVEMDNHHTVKLGDGTSVYSADGERAWIGVNRTQANKKRIRLGDEEGVLTEVVQFARSPRCFYLKCSPASVTRTMRELTLDVLSGLNRAPMMHATCRLTDAEHKECVNRGWLIGHLRAGHREAGG